MTRRIPGKLLPHRILLKPFLGSGAYGERWGQEEEIKRSLVEDRQTVVIGPEGQDVVSGTRVYLEPRDIRVGSLVTVWPGTANARESKVLAIARLDHPQGLSHLVLYLK